MTIALTALAAAPPPLDPSLVEFYRRLMLELQDRAIQRLVRDGRALTAEAKRARLLMSEVEQILTHADNEGAKWIAENVTTSYKRGVRSAEQGLREIGLTSIPDLNPAIHQEALQVLVNNLQDSLAEGHDGIAKGYRRLVKRTQLTAARDKLVTEQIAQGVGAGKARREVSKRIMQELISELGDKPLVINGRHYDPKSYAEMVARTMTREAQTAGTVNRCLEAGVDTVMITAHGAKDGCGFYEGKAFSISGTHPDYPPLDSLPNGGPPFHPNCKHVTAPFVESFASGAEKRRATGVPSGALNTPMGDVEKLVKAEAK